MSSDYILTADSLNLKKSDFNHKLIYIVLSSYGTYAPKVLYIGQASSIVSRFASHRALQWHQQNLNCPAQVTIAANILASDVDAAEQELMTIATQQGFLLLNRAITDAASKAIQGSGALEDMSHDALIAHLTSPSPSRFDYTSWLQKWASQQGVPRATTSHEESVFFLATGDDIRLHPDFKALPATSTGEQLSVHLMRQSADIYKTHGATGLHDKRVAEHLALDYDPLTGFSAPSRQDLSRHSTIHVDTLGKCLVRLTRSGLWASADQRNDRPLQYFPLFVQGGLETYTLMRDWKAGPKEAGFALLARALKGQTHEATGIPLSLLRAAALALRVRSQKDDFFFHCRSECMADILTDLQGHSAGVDQMPRESEIYQEILTRSSHWFSAHERCTPSEYTPYCPPGHDGPWISARAVKEKKRLERKRSESAVVGGW